MHIKSLIFSLFIVLALSSTYKEDDSVLVLNKDNFDDAIKEFNHILVEFYAPWCGHCKKLAPEYAKAANTLKEKNSKVRLAKVDATVEKDLATKYNVQSYPTLIWFENGVTRDYDGDRTAGGLVEWVRQNSEPPSRLLEDSNTIDMEIAKGSLVFVYWGDITEPEYSIFANIAKKLRDFSNWHSTNPAHKAALGVPADVKISLFRNFEEKRVDLNEEYSDAGIRKFIDNYSKPAVIIFSQVYARKIFGDRSNDALFLFRRKQDSQKVDELKTAADSLRGKILVVDANIEEEYGKKALTQFGAEESLVPFVGIIHFTPNKQMEKYILEGEINATSIIQFSSDYKSGKLKRILRSEPEPTTNDGASKKVFGKTWEKIILDKTKDAVVFIYGPFDKHSKAFKDNWENLAKNLAGIKDLVVAKFDATQNEVEGLEVKSYPTILFYPANNKQNPIKFTEQRSEENIWAWLKKHLTVAYDAKSIVYEKAKNQEL